MSLSSFTKKILRFTFTLQDGVFDSTGNNVLTVQGLAASVQVSQASGIMSQAETSVFGMKQSDMNALSTLAALTLKRQYKIPGDTVLIEAGDVETGLTEVFYGDIFNAWADYQGAPDVYLKISASVLAHEKITSTTPVSYKGYVDAEQVFTDIAKKAGLTLENSGVQRKIHCPYLTGSTIDQAKTLAKAVDCNIHFEQKKIIICPKDKSRAADGEVYHLSAKSGLVGYPGFDNMGVVFSCLYTPEIKLLGDVNIEMQTDLAGKVNADIARQNGNNAVTTWHIVQMAYILTSEIANGPWFINAVGSSVKNAVRVK